jgi:dihydrofolate reductase
MRRIIGAGFVSLDGVMQAPGGPGEDPTGGFPYGGWLFPYGDEAFGNQIDTLFGRPFDLLLGRRTWRIFANYWPHIPDDNAVSHGFRRCRKYVLTHSEAPLEWEGSERVADLDALERIKAGDGPDLVIQGSTTLYPPLMARGLIDRLVLIVAPVVLGRGKRMFGADTAGRSFRLVEHRLTGTGVSMATYDLAGEVETGSFEETKPAPEELARREKMAREDDW